MCIAAQHADRVFSIGGRITKIFTSIHPLLRRPPTDRPCHHRRHHAHNLFWPMWCCWVSLSQWENVRIFRRSKEAHCGGRYPSFSSCSVSSIKPTQRVNRKLFIGTSLEDSDYCKVDITSLSTAYHLFDLKEFLAQRKKKTSKRNSIQNDIRFLFTSPSPPTTLPKNDNGKVDCGCGMLLPLVSIPNYPSYFDRSVICAKADNNDDFTTLHAITRTVFDSRR